MKEIEKKSKAKKISEWMCNQNATSNATKHDWEAWMGILVGMQSM